MDVTIKEVLPLLDPPMTHNQIAALIWMHVIPAIGTRQLPQRGRPASTYSLSEIKRAHAIETRRTAKQFMDTDWIASALLALELIRVDCEVGEIRWFSGERAERLGNGNYGYVRAGPERCPAHRLIWIAAEGEIPVAMQVNHINQLRWDNRRANLEIVSFGNNIRHAYGSPYLTYHEAVRQLAAPQPSAPMPAPAESLVRAGAFFRHPGN